MIALAAVSQPGEALYCADWSGSSPTGWRIDVESTIVMYDNVGARQLYERMGFRTYRESAVRVVSRCS